MDWALLPSSSTGIVISLIVVTFLLFKYMTRNFEYWKNRGVFYEKPLPFLGNTFDVFLLKCTLGDWLKNACHANKQPYFGIFVFDKPFLIVRDRHLIKQILINDFHIFRNRSVASGDHDKMMKEVMFFQKYPNWKLSRSHLSRVYSTSNLRKMLNMMDEVGKSFVEYVENHLGDIQDVKDLTSRYTIEVISQSTFGLKPDCFKTKKPEFFDYGERVFERSLRNSFYQLCFFFKQDWVDPFRMVFFPKDVMNYFANVFQQSMEVRRKTGQKANDLIDIMNDARCKEKININDTILTAGAFQIFVGGFETTSTAIAFLIYELVRNQSIQKRLRNEILEIMKKHGGITYEALSEMKYLDMCLSETLRKYPTLPFLDRKCSEDYKLQGTDLVIEKGMDVYIPITAIHMDENLYPNPYKFDPERFEGGDLNKDGLIYLPFGAGPRSCFGSRFGLLASKACMCHFLSRFEVIPNSKTQEKITMSVRSQLTLAEGGLPMTIRKYVPEG